MPGASRPASDRAFRVMAVSDLHADHEPNQRWLDGLSLVEFQADVLVVAGDVSDDVSTLQRTLDLLCRRFRHVLFVPGNHELWVGRRQAEPATSHRKFERVVEVARQSGARMRALHLPGLRIVPLLAWYDYSFGLPNAYLHEHWMDYRECRWPAGWQPRDVAAWLFERNIPEPPRTEKVLITFSHFLPRLDLMPTNVPQQVKQLFPVLGSARLDDEIRRLGAAIHVYGHSHLNRDLVVGGIRYVNNAFGYPHETSITLKDLVCIHEHH